VGEADGPGTKHDLDHLRSVMAKKKRSPKKDLAAIERAAKRDAQKAQGALDGRFRTKKVESGKRYSLKGKPKNINPEE